MEESDNPAQRIRYGTGRLEAFSDGVFAVAITLLVLEISVPAGSENDLWRAVIEQWPSYLGYIVSFATVGAIWLGHSAVSHYLGWTDVGLLRLNLLLLLAVSFLPFPTRLMAENVDHEAAGRVASTIYGVSLFIATVVLWGVWRYASSASLIREDADGEEVARLTRKLTPGLAGYIVMIGLGVFFPVAAVLGYLLIAIYFLVPLGRRRL